MRHQVVVVGAGVAGLTATITAAEAGAEVTVVEGSAQAGGAAALSNGSVWTFGSAAEFLRHCPGADPGIAALVCGRLGEALRWLGELGVTVTPRGPSIYGPAESSQVAPEELVAVLGRAAARCARGWLADRVTGLARTGHGGLVLRTAAGQDVSAGSVVLATGGIHADPVLLAAAGLGHYRDLPLRNREPSGDGVRLARDRGAALAGPRDGIYGHLVPSGIAPPAALSAQAAQYHSHGGVLIGWDGTALAPPGTQDHHLNRILAGRSEHRGVLVFDAMAVPPGPARGAGEAAARFAFAQRHGTRAVQADRCDELLDTAAAWIGAALRPPARRVAAAVLRHRPYFAVEVSPSITHAGVGLRVDGRLRVDGLDGAFAAGAEIGNAWGSGYGGGLALALTTGRAAGQHAAAAFRGGERADA